MLVRDIILSPSLALPSRRSAAFLARHSRLSARLVAQTELDGCKAQKIGGHAPGAGRLSLTSSPVSILSDELNIVCRCAIRIFVENSFV